MSESTKEEREARAKRGNDEIQTILKRERLVIRLHSLSFRPDGGVNPIIQILAEEDIHKPPNAPVNS